MSMHWFSSLPWESKLVYWQRQDSHGEVLRLIDTFQLAAEESTRMYGAALTASFFPFKVHKPYLPRVWAPV